MIADVGAEKLKDTGRVMTELKSRYPGQMDFAKARRMICQRLADRAAADAGSGFGRAAHGRAEASVAAHS